MADSNDKIQYLQKQNQVFKLINDTGNEIKQDQTQPDKLCTLSAQIVQISPIQPRIVLACYICENCHSKIYVPIQKQFKSTTVCSECNNSTNVVFSSNDSKFIDEVSLLLKNEDGTYGAVWSEKGTESGLKAEFSIGTHIKAQGFWQIDISIDDVNRNSYNSTFIIQQYQLQQAHNEQVEQIIPTPVPIEQLTQMFAPNIQGLTYPKLALLCSIVGSSSTNKRSLLHTLLVGDPGVAKSQLLKEACKLLPKSVFTSGKSTSKAGLTAAVVLAPTTSIQGLTKKQNMVLQQQQSRPQILPGALLIANGGLVAIDEFDKLDSQDTTAIYEVLEQQTLSIAKAGVSASMPAKTTVIAACNPKNSVWDTEKSLIENIDIAEALISRFDIVFVMKDQKELEQDRKLGLFVAQRFMNNQSQTEQQSDNKNSNSNEKLAQYVQYARTLNPEIPPSLYSQYIDYYCKQRQIQEFTTPRLLLSVIRISQALAKLRLSKYVEKQDLILAEQLMEVSMEASQEQKEIENKKPINTLNRQIRELLTKNSSVKMSEIKNKYGEDGVKEIKKLSAIGVVIIDGTGSNPNIILV